MIDAESWDWAGQRAKAVEAVGEVMREARFAEGHPVVIAFHFVPEVAGARPGALMEDLRAAGYSAGIREAREGRPKTLAASCDLALSVEAVWAEEERATRIALACGFGPFGWSLTG